MKKYLIFVLIFSWFINTESFAQLEITTDEGIEVFQIEKYYLLKKNVIITSDNFNLSADNVKAYFDKDLYDIIRIESFGNAKINSKNNIKGSGDKINFSIKDENINIFGINSSLIFNNIIMKSNKYIKVQNISGYFDISGKDSVLKTDTIEITGSKINGNYIKINETNQIKDLYVQDDVLSNIKTKKINMYSMKAQYQKDKNLIELFDNVKIYRNNEIIVGDYAKINTLTESYNVKSNNKQKVKILINNSENDE